MTQNIPLSIYQDGLLRGPSWHLHQVRGGTCMIGDESGDMGYEKPVHEVELDSFWIGRYPVSQQLWQAVMETKSPSYWLGEDRSVEEVSWEECQAFLDRLNTKLELSGSFAYRLPTSAEWEFAARGGRYSSHFLYAGAANLDRVGWYAGNSVGQTHAVGLKMPNELGLYDMSGNLWEWVEDWYEANYYQECLEKGLAKNPRGPETAEDRVLRGGGWSNGAEFCGPAFRNFGAPGYRNYDIGFRLARTAL